MEDIERHDMVFAIGPGGTGKTYLAVAMAVSALLGKQVNRIILARPAVEAGERLGFLPGTLQQKIDPYMRPLYDALYDLLDTDKLELFLDKGIIEVAPLAFMRGRTLNDSFVILDEAQNTTSEQMKMFLTRLGFNSKAVITGDITQMDLPSGRRSGLVEAIEVVGQIEGIAFVYFNERDVVRHNLVQQIIKAYDEFASTPAGRRARQAATVRPAIQSGDFRRTPIARFGSDDRESSTPHAIGLAALVRFRRACSTRTRLPGKRVTDLLRQRSGHGPHQSQISRQVGTHRCVLVSCAAKTHSPAALARQRETTRAGTPM